MFNVREVNPEEEFVQIGDKGLMPDIFEAVICIHRPCPTRTGLAVGCFYVEIEGLSSRELFSISVLTIFNVKAQVPPHTAA